MNIFARKSNDRKFVPVINGRFEYPIETARHGAESRITKSGRMKYFIAGAALEGFVWDVSFHERSYDEMLNITMLNLANDRLLVITCGAMSPFAQSFYVRMEGVDWSLPLKFECVPVRKGPYLRTYASLIQQGGRLPNLYQSDEAKAAIPRYERLSNGTWDTSAALAYWKKKIDALIFPQLTEMKEEIAQFDTPTLGTAFTANMPMDWHQRPLSEIEADVAEANRFQQLTRGDTDPEGTEDNLPF